MAGALTFSPAVSWFFYSPTLLNHLVHLNHEEALIDYWFRVAGSSASEPRGNPD